ncbi:MAG: meso-butanediol dehydrogenase / (S,S)-butanediol dehydrogenase / diacetyl reductase [Gaiellaceae bacterium]|nr:meso-butanediol dehydrogenase / (S,S)-butanediol dehydrogenase / diacetyl reductase [Gaiellaceae bacterium]
MRFPRGFRGEEEPFGSPAPSSPRSASHLPTCKDCSVDKAALVTGGSSGIGFAIASMLRENGFALTLAARTRTKVEVAAEALGAHPVAADVANADDCRRLVDEHRQQHGRLDVLVNSAGVGIAGSIDELDTKHIDLQLNVNLRGTMLVTAAALPLLRESGGLIVNLASIAGTIPSPQLPVYGASKAAVIQFTNTLNRGEEKHGIRATAISPGFVDTPMAQWAPIPTDEMIRPEDCAEIVRTLLNLSPHARIPHVVVERVSAGGSEA